MSQKCCVYCELADQEGLRTVITSGVDLVPPVHRPTPLLTNRNKSSSGEWIETNWLPSKMQHCLASLKLTVKSEKKYMWPSNSSLWPMQATTVAEVVVIEVVVSSGIVVVVGGDAISYWHIGAILFSWIFDIRQLKSSHQKPSSCITIKPQSSVFPAIVLGKLGPQDE